MSDFLNEKRLGLRHVEKDNVTSVSSDSANELQHILANRMRQTEAKIISVPDNTKLRNGQCAEGKPGSPTNTVPNKSGKPDLPDKPKQIEGYLGALMNGAKTKSLYNPATQRERLGSKETEINPDKPAVLHPKPKPPLIVSNKPPTSHTSIQNEDGCRGVSTEIVITPPEKEVKLGVSQDDISLKQRKLSRSTQFRRKARSETKSYTEPGHSSDNSADGEDDKTLKVFASDIPIDDVFGGDAEVHTADRKSLGLKERSERLLHVFVDKIGISSLKNSLGREHGSSVLTKDVKTEEDEGTTQWYPDPDMEEGIYVDTDLADPDSDEADPRGKPLRERIRSQLGMRTLWCKMPEVVSALIHNTIEENEKRLQESLFEIISSEITYLKSLEVLLKLFKKANCIKVTIAQRQHYHIFQNTEQVYEASKWLVSEFEKLWEKSCTLQVEEICQVLSTASNEHFDCYVNYLENQPQQQKAIDKLRAENTCFDDAISELEKHPSCMCMTLESLLLQPMQRITRLPLLLKEVVKHVSEDKAVLVEECCRKLHMITKEGERRAKKTSDYQDLTHINRSLDFGKRQSIRIVTESRSLIREVEVKAAVIYNKKPARASPRPKAEKEKTFWLVLFNDLLLITSKDSSGTLKVEDHSPRAFVAAEALEEDSVTTWLPEGLPTSMITNLTLLVLMKQRTKYVVSFEKQKEQGIWVKAFSPPEVDSEGTTANHEYDLPEVEVIRKFADNDPTHLDLEPSHVIKVLKNSSNGWSEGEDVTTKKTGWFLRKHTKSIDCAHNEAKKLREELAAAKTFLGISS